MERRFVLDRENAKIMGVGAGLANLLGIDALIVRLGLILALLTTGPVALVLYVAAGLLAANG